MLWTRDNFENDAFISSNSILHSYGYSISYIEEYANIRAKILEIYWWILYREWKLLSMNASFLAILFVLLQQGQSRCIFDRHLFDRFIDENCANVASQIPFVSRDASKTGNFNVSGSDVKLAETREPEEILRGDTF